MELEKFIQILIYIHAGFGGIALLTGAIALIAKKGSRPHKKAGKVFYYTMLIAAALSLVIAIMPNHWSPFLFSIGIFSSYFLLSGYRSLRFKAGEPNLLGDRILAGLILVTGILMILYPILLNGKTNVVLLVFGIVGVIFGVTDLISFNDRQKLKRRWMRMHLGKMIGGYIAAVSAFLVVNQVLPGAWNWFIAGIIGSVYITYWNIKLSRKKPKLSRE